MLKPHIRLIWNGEEEVEVYVDMAMSNNKSWMRILSWLLVGCFGFNGPLRQYFSLYRAVSKEREKEERKDR